MSNGIQMSDQQKDDARYVMDLMKDNEPFLHDLRDEKQYRFVKHAFESTGKTVERYPGLFGSIEAGRTNGPKVSANFIAEDNNGFKSGAMITSTGVTKVDDKTASEGFLSIINGASIANMVMKVYDGNTTTVLAQGSVSEYHHDKFNFLPIQTDNSTAHSPSSQLSSVLTYSYQITPGGEIQHGSVKMNRSLGVSSDPVITQPVQKPNHQTEPYIEIGLGRGLGDQYKDDLDYWFWQHTSNLTFAVPFVGNVTFTGNIKALTPDHFSLFVTLAKKDGGYKTLTGNELDAVRERYSISSQKVLSWNLPWAEKEADCHPIIFGMLNWASDSVTYFTCTMMVDIEGQQEPAYASVSSLDMPDEDQNDGVLYIKPIQWQYHCLAEGTEIVMADESVLKIEELNSNHSVMTGNKGTTLPVRSTFVGSHKGPARKITTEDNHVLTLSECHIVMTPEGPCQAKRLNIGDTILVKEGTAKIRSNELIEFDGFLYNIKLGNSVDHKEMIDSNDTQMFANGILVGDQQMQNSYDKWYQTEEVVLKSIDPDFHTDYRSFLEDRA